MLPVLERLSVDVVEVVAKGVTDAVEEREAVIEEDIVPLLVVVADAVVLGEALSARQSPFTLTLDTEPLLPLHGSVNVTVEPGATLPMSTAPS